MTQALSVRELRSRWKPHKERLQAADPSHPTNVRFHRACSWLQRAEEGRADADLDVGLLYHWIALNALYGQWDEAAQQPLPDGPCLRMFLDRILALDRDGAIEQTLVAERELVMAILDDEYLSRFFWRDPSEQQARRARKALYDARGWYFEKNWTMILDRALERVYTLRCQLAHGAATHGSGLNRAALARCTDLLHHLLPALLVVLIDHGADEDWGQMCYPPLSAASVPRA